MTATPRFRTPVLALMLVVCGLSAGCNWDTASDRYETRAAAEAAGVFGNDLLPDFVPMSARAIEIHDDADFKIVSGQFEFSPADFAPFLARLHPGTPATHPWPIDKEWPQAAQGATAASYEADGNVWVFFCRRDAGQCRFYSWPKDYPFK